jgi:hypothetical protein
VRSALPLLLLCAACVDEPHGERVISRVERLVWKTNAPKQFDVLFVVDSSPAMATHDATWRANQRTMMNVLASMEGGLPSVHIGVVTTDLGTLGHDGNAGDPIGDCDGDGDAGELHAGSGIVGRFISNIALADGSRQTNYVGPLPDAFVAIANVGAQGCRYVQPLEAMMSALASNAGFLRPDAYLWVVFITPNDDCSFAHGGFAVESNAVNAHECFTRDRELVSIDAYEQRLRSLKADPSKIFVSVIAGPNEVNVADGPEGLEAAPSCVMSGASALPAVRLRELVERFPNRASFTTICQQNWSDAIYSAQLPTRPWGAACFESPPADRSSQEGLQAECTVSYRRPQGEQLIRPCGDEPERPCWRIVEDPQRCSSTPHATIQLLPAIEPATETIVVAECVVE